MTLISCKSIQRKHEDVAETYFQETTIRDSKGQFIVRLPLKKDPFLLGVSFSMAKQWFSNIEKKLTKDQKFAIDYNLFMSDYIKLGRMKQIYDVEIVYYFSHHRVFKTDI